MLRRLHVCWTAFLFHASPFYWLLKPPLIGTNGGRTNRIRHTDTIWPEFLQLGGGKKRANNISAQPAWNLARLRERCPVRRRPGSAHTVPRMEIQGQGKKSNISPLGGNLKCATSEFCWKPNAAQRQRWGCCTQGERERRGGKRVTRAMKDGWE